MQYHSSYPEGSWPNVDSAQHINRLGATQGDSEFLFLHFSVTPSPLNFQALWLAVRPSDWPPRPIDCPPYPPRPSRWLPDPLGGVQTLRPASQVLWLASRSSGQPPIPSCYYIFRLASQTLWLTFRPSQAYWLACQCLGALIAVPRVSASASTVLWEYKKKIWY